MNEIVSVLVPNHCFELGIGDTKIAVDPGRGV
jgi:hypothetical protein